MKTSRLTSFVAAFFLSVALLLSGSPVRVAGACLADAFDKIFATLLLRDVSIRLKDKVEQNLTRWAALPINERKTQAILEIEKSLCVAQDTAKKSFNKDVGEFTAEAQAKVLTGDGALASSRTSLEDAAKGIAVIAARAEVSDLTGKQCVEGIEKAITTGNSTTVQTFRDANYTVVEALHDLETVLVPNPDLPAGKMFKDGQNPGKLGSLNGNPGAVAEVGFAARRVRSGKRPIDLGADEGTGPFAGKKVDQHWEDHIYQVGFTSNTIKDKLEDVQSLAPVIKQALETLEIEKAAGRMPQSARFKFGYTVQAGWVPDPSPAGVIDNLNIELTRLYAPGTPPQVFRFDDQIKDFELLSLAEP